MDETAILEFLRADPKRGWTMPEIANRLGVPEERSKSLRRVLKGLLKRGDIERDRGRSFRISRVGQSVEGRVNFDERGVAWIALADPKTKPIQVVPEDAARLEEGDRVRVELVGAGGRRGHVHGHVTEIIERPQLVQLAVFRHIGKVIFVELEAEGKERRSRRSRVPVEVLVPAGETNGAVDGQLVRVEITRKGRGATASSTARVLEVLGKPGERDTEMRRLMLDHRLSVEFPKEADDEAKKYGSVPSEEDIRGRRDLRDLPLVTIDGETAKDFDDAVCAVRNGRDGYILYVAIADVSHYVRPRTALDAEAQARGTSTYLTDRAIPMLPEALSNHLCSLMPHVDRLCMVAELTLDRSGHLEKTAFYEAVMKSQARLTYTRVAQAIEGQPDEECQKLLPTILLLAKVAALLLERRLKRGAIDLDLAEPFVVYDENHFPVDVLKRERNDAHRLIEDLMLAANEAVAGFFVDRSLPTLFRVHEDPDPEKLQTFVDLLGNFGIRTKMKKNPRPKDVAHLLEKLSEHPTAKSLNFLLLRSLMQARYDADCKGHYGLAAERYLHFTSPIRRYPDLMVHRLLRRVLQGEGLGYSKDQLQDIAQKSSDAERRAMVAERESMDLDRAYVALEHLGESFTATITSVVPFGLFASIDKPFIEGMIPVWMLGGDDFEIDEHNVRLTGASSGAQFTIGQKLEVEIASVNIGRRQVELKLVGVEAVEREDRPRRPRDGEDRERDRERGGDRTPRRSRSAKPGDARKNNNKPPFKKKKKRDEERRPRKRR